MRRILVDSGILLSYYQQREPLHHAVSRGGIDVIHLLPEDYERIADLNTRHADLPGDFADLTLVALSERLDVREILTLDRDFDVYRCFRKEPFERITIA